MGQCMGMMEEGEGGVATTMGTYLGQMLNLMKDHGLVGKLNKGLGEGESKRAKTSAKT